MKIVLSRVLILSSLCLATLIGACGKQDSEESTLNASSSSNVTVKDVNGGNYVLTRVNVGGQVFIGCPSKPALLGGRLDIPGNVKSFAYAGKTYNYLWFQGTSKVAVANAACRNSGGNKSNNGCTCVAPAGAFKKLSNGAVVKS